MGLNPIRRKVFLLGIALALGLAACSSPPKEPVSLLAPTDAQMKMRNLQTRTFSVEDREKAIRGVIAALQDLGFIIERANAPLGMVTAAKFAEPNFYDVIGLTVTVRPAAEGQSTIRVNAIHNNKPIEDPEVYRNFFATLERSFFIERN